jgi:hypothetical protein
MSAIRIAKGYPISLLVSVNNDGTPINLNDGTWTYSASLHYQTKEGPIPFDISTTISNEAFLVELANTQTSQLNHLGTGYVLVIDAFKIDQTAYIQEEILVSVTDGL